MFDAIEHDYEQGRYATAFQAARAAGLFDVDPSAPPDHTLLAARIRRVCGAERAGRKQILDTWRRHRRHPRAAIYAVHELSDEGPLVALDAMARIGDLADLQGATIEDRADWLCARALWLADLRDFLGADAAWQAARDLHTGAWTWCVRATIDLDRDRPDAALAALAEARALRPWFRPTVHLEARALMRARRADAARTLLVEASGQLEALSIDLQLAARHREAGDLEGAVSALLRAVTRAPAMERRLHDHLARSLSHVHYLRGDAALASRLLRLVDDDAARAESDRIAARSGKRRLLPVPHVPQDHHTCAPATLTAIAEHWGEPVSHAELAEEICHDGTPAGSERKWAEERGFVARQLTVTWDALRALIDAGIPIALTTSFTLGGHLQPVAGYDEIRRTVLIAEPGATEIREVDWDELAVDQAPFGPRGMVFLPTREEHRLHGIELPDAALYDHLFAIEAALERHDRGAAQAAYDELLVAAPAEHYLRHQALRALASYDGDRRGTLAWVAGLRASHPNHEFLRLVELTSRRGHEAHDRRAALAAELLEKHVDDPAILVACGRFLWEVGDATRAMALMSRALRRAHPHAGSLDLAADLTWVAGERARATTLYRYVSCLAEGDEAAAWAYFTSALTTGDVETSLAHLRDRVARMASRSGGPAQTLCEAYTAIGRASEGVALLERAIAEHPDEGELLLVAERQHRLGGDLAKASARLESARGRVPELAWRRAAAANAVHRGDHDAAIPLLRALTTDNPLDIDSQRSYVALLERTGAAQLAREHVAAVSGAYPFHIPLAQLTHEVLVRHDRLAARRHLEAFVERQPRSAWALRLLADSHLAAQDLVSARVMLDRARAYADDQATIDAAEAELCTREGHRDRAMAYLRAALARDVDEPGAVHELLCLASDTAEATRLLDAVDAELARQGSAGIGVTAYAHGLRRWADSPTALARLRALRRARPHQWPTWAAEVDALIDAGRVDDAAAVAREASGRFGHESRAWQKLATVETVRERHDAAAEALARALAIQPHRTDLMRELSDAYAEAGHRDLARTLLERASNEDPLDGLNLGYLAALVHAGGDLAAARAYLLRATELAPDYGWGWERLREWSDNPSAVVEHARAVIEKAPAAIVPRSLLASLDTDLPLAARLALLDDAIRLAPDRVDLHDDKVVLLVTHELWEEALEACRPAFWGSAPPVSLSGRAAWIRHERGEHVAAFDDMLAVVGRNPSYEWGIGRLVAWSDDGPVSLRERIVAAAPRSARAHAALGEARRRAGDVSGAEASLRRALDLDATDQLARLELFDILYQAESYDAATPLLELLDDENPYVLARKVQLAAVTGRRDEADRAMTRMLVDLDVEDPVPVREAIAGYRAGGMRAHADELLNELIRRPEAPRAVGRAWWDHYDSRLLGRWAVIRALPRSPATAYCVESHVGSMLGGAYGVRLLMFALFNRRLARTWPALWGSIGWALVEEGHYGMARRWMRDHEQRTDISGWMLAHLARALVAGNDFARAVQVCRRVLALPRDGMTARARLLLAPIIALDDPEGARREIAAARTDDLETDDRFLAGVSEALILYARDPDRGPSSVQALVRTLGALWARPGTRPTFIARRIYDHVVERICQARGSEGAALRAQLRRLTLGF